MSACNPAQMACRVSLSENAQSMEDSVAARPRDNDG